MHILAADITDASAIQAAADKTSEFTGGALDLLINNAGLSGNDESAFLSLPDMEAGQVEKYFTASFVSRSSSTRERCPRGELTVRARRTPT